MVRLLTVVVFPALALLAVLAPILIPWLFGPAWVARRASDADPRGRRRRDGRHRCRRHRFHGRRAGRARCSDTASPTSSVTSAPCSSLRRGGSPPSRPPGSAVHLVFVLVAYQILLRGRADRAVRFLWNDVSAAMRRLRRARRRGRAAESRACERRSSRHCRTSSSFRAAGAGVYLASSASGSPPTRATSSSSSAASSRTAGSRLSASPARSRRAFDVTRLPQKRTARSIVVRPWSPRASCPFRRGPPRPHGYSAATASCFARCRGPAAEAGFGVLSGSGEDEPGALVVLIGAAGQLPLLRDVRLAAERHPRRLHPRGHPGGRAQLAVAPRDPGRGDRHRPGGRRGACADPYRACDPRRPALRADVAVAPDSTAAALAPREADHGADRRGPDEPGDRGTSVPRGEHGQDTCVVGVPQARCALARRGRRADAGPRVRPGLASLALADAAG